MSVTSFFNSIKIILKLKFVWTWPKHGKVLIYDREGSEKLLEYLFLKQVRILDVRNESINIPVLFLNLLKGKLTKKKYNETYIKIINPDIIITFIDNNPEFYELKKINSKMVTIFIQNGCRGEFTDIFDYLKKDLSHVENKVYKVDYMLTFGEAVAKKYRQYISGNSLIIGSFLNNMVKVKRQPVKNTLLFLSQYRPNLNTKSVPLFYRLGNPIFWDDFYLPEKFFLPLLFSYAKSKNLNLKICGCTLKKYHQEEIDFYEKLIGVNGWDFLPRDSVLSNYEKIDKSEFVVFIDTTLGYEALSRGIKGAAFSARGYSVLSSEGHNFGWPSNISDDGSFWTNKLDEGQFEKIMNFVTTCTDNQWRENLNQYYKDIMIYDAGNVKFLELMKDLEVSLSIKYR